MDEPIIFSPVPTQGFSREQILAWVKQGYTAWGIAPVYLTSEGEDGSTHGEVMSCMVMVRRTDTLPSGLLGYHIVKARESNGGLNYLAQTFFGVSLPELVRVLGGKRATPG